MTQRTTISQIVTAVYCEQKAVHDNDFGTKADMGDPRQAELQARASDGIMQHLRFEREGRVLVASGGRTDQRCFVASAIFGHQAVETEWLRGWRDRVLLTNTFGRVFVWGYYKFSPFMVVWLRNAPKAQRTVKSLLRQIMIVLGYKA